MLNVLRGSPYAKAETSFENFSMRIYEKRWHAVAQFIAGVWPLLLIIRGCWDEMKFRARDGAEDDDANQRDAGSGDIKFCPTEMTRIVRSNFFFAYMQCLMMVHMFTKRLSSWCEGCTCHEHLLLGKRRIMRGRDHDMVAEILVWAMNAEGRRKEHAGHREGKDKVHEGGNAMPHD